MLNAVTATGDGTVMTTIAVTRTSTTLNSLLLTFDIIHSSITSFHTLEPMFSSVRNFSSKLKKQKFQTGETKKFYIELQTDHKEPLKTRQCDSKICRHTAVTYCRHLINHSYSRYYTQQSDR